VTYALRRKETLNGEQLSAMLAENPARAAQAILSAAKARFVDAQALLGQILLDGTGIQKDPALAVVWFQIAAKNGHVMAHNMLGRCHEQGWGCDVDWVKAAVHYQKAADAGLDWGLYNLANLLATGRGVTEDQHRALACYRKAAHMGHAKSMNLLGRYLEDGRYCEADIPAAHGWYKHSAEAGDFRGQFSHAAVLAEQGLIADAVFWLGTALQGGNLNFLRVSRRILLCATHPDIRAMALDFSRRAAELGDDVDHAVLESLQRTNGYCYDH
jgi:TPR repeat protein